MDLPSLFTAGLAIPAALLLDRLLGEPRSRHPLVAFGRAAEAVELRLNGPPGLPVRHLKEHGLVAWILLLAPPVALAALLAGLPIVGPAVGVLILYLTVGGRSLSEHALAVADALGQGDMATARARVGGLVSRDVEALDEEGTARAGIESVLENGCDAVFGALFWFAVLGAPGAVLYRLANTLDAMWGYRTHRFSAFGWGAARLDDLLNWIPARLTALTYVVMAGRGGSASAWRAMQNRPAWKSPNAGWVMAAGAGALKLTLGGPAPYHGAMREAPRLGDGRPPRGGDLARAVGLVERGMLLWGGFALIGWGIGHA